MPLNLSRTMNIGAPNRYVVAVKQPFRESFHTLSVLT